ncbi:MAG: acylphosphatase [Candidatus Micrarchaeota archaeon]
MAKAVQARVLAIIHGDVQGVGFRFTVFNLAQKFKVNGFVRNLRDGTVEVQAEGEKEQLEKFISAIKIKDGWINVEKIDLEWGKAKNEFRDFSILRRE